jgi:hypothetical protein
MLAYCGAQDKHRDRNQESFHRRDLFVERLDAISPVNRRRRFNRSISRRKFVPLYRITGDRLDSTFCGFVSIFDGDTG